MLATFLAYAFPDFVIWKINLWKGIKAAALEKLKNPDIDNTNKEEQIANMIGAVDAKMSSWASWSNLTSIVRGIFDFAVPVLVGAYAFYALLNYHPHQKPPPNQPAEVLILPPL